MRRVSTQLVLLILCIAAWVGAAWVRLRALDQVVVGSDSLGPYLQALAFTPEAIKAGVLPKPPNPESGDFLWISALPFVHAASSLVDLFRLRFIASAVIAPLGLLAAWVWAAPSHVQDVWEKPTWGQAFAAIAAGTVLAVDPGLTDTLVSGARGYGAPELLTLCTLGVGLAWRGSAFWAVVAASAFVIASGHHPLAAGMLLGLVAVLPGLGTRLDLVAIATAVVFGLMFALPRILRLLAVMDCGEGAAACLSEVAQSNVAEDVQIHEILLKATHDRLLVDLGPWMTVGLGTGLILSRPWTGSGALAVGGTLGMVLMAIVTGYLQSYHLRILAGPLSVAAAVGLATIWPLAGAWAVWAVMSLLPQVPVGPDPGAAERHDEVALKLVELEGPLWVDRVWWDGRPVLDPSAVVLSAVLQGQDSARFTVGDDVSLVLMTVGDGPKPPADRLLAGVVAASETPWAVYTGIAAPAAASWINNKQPHQVGGAWDWLVALQPTTADMEATRW